MESEGCRFASSLRRNEKSFIISPQGVAFTLWRESNLSLWLGGAWNERGVYDVVDAEKLKVRPNLQIDNGATVTVVQGDWRDVLVSDRVGPSIRGVGGHVSKSVGGGSFDIRFSEVGSVIPLGAMSSVFGIPPVVHLVDVEATWGCDNEWFDDGLSTRHSWFEGVLSAEPSWEAGRFSPIESPQRMVELLGTAKASIINKAHLLYNGVKPMRALSNAELRDDAVRKGGSIRRRVRSARTNASMARDADVVVGTSWSWDFIPPPGECIDGYVAAILFVEKKTAYPHTVPVYGKTTADLIDAVDQLKLFITSGKPGVFLQVLHGDFDPAWARQGHGNLLNTRLWESYVRQSPIDCRRSTPEVHEQNPNESHTWAVFWLMTMNLSRAGLSTRCWWDMWSAAVAQRRAHLSPKNKNITIHEAYWGKGRKMDVSEWIAHQGQLVFVTLNKGKASQGRPRAEAGLFIMPAEKSGGFLVRMFRILRSTSSR